ncbi:hypothetical protein ZWY2020_025585 [Hordeum vulgare]|nr:hypothetical protein ZWY2020_025585 [Hordeum vulgare]
MDGSSDPTAEMRLQLSPCSRKRHHATQPPSSMYTYKIRNPPRAEFWALAGAFPRIFFPCFFPAAAAVGIASAWQ